MSGPGRSSRGAWLVLVVSGLFEAVWATALAESEGLRRLVPVVVFVIGSVISMVGLARAMRHIAVGTAYAVWTGIGAVTTAAYAMATGAEAVSPLKMMLLGGVIGCVVGLQLTESHSGPGSPRSGPADPRPGGPGRAAS